MDKHTKAEVAATEVVEAVQNEKKDKKPWWFWVVIGFAVFLCLLGIIGFAVFMGRKYNEFLAETSKNYEIDEEQNVAQTSKNYEIDEDEEQNVAQNSKDKYFQYTDDQKTKAYLINIKGIIEDIKTFIKNPNHPSRILTHRFERLHSIMKQDGARVTPNFIYILLELKRQILNLHRRVQLYRNDVPEIASYINNSCYKTAIKLLELIHDQIESGKLYDDKNIVPLYLQNVKYQKFISNFENYAIHSMSVLKKTKKTNIDDILSKQTESELNIVDELLDGKVSDLDKMIEMMVPFINSVDATARNPELTASQSTNPQIEDIKREPAKKVDDESPVATPDYDQYRLTRLLNNAQSILNVNKRKPEQTLTPEKQKVAKKKKELTEMQNTERYGKLDTNFDNFLADLEHLETE